jgi:ABC-type proline/glycine betaine transport system permease subunit
MSLDLPQKGNRFTRFVRHSVFSETEIARNPIWISLREQALNFAWDGSFFAAVIDSIFNVLFRTIVLIITALFLPLGLIALMEQVFRNIIDETWDTLQEKYGFNFLSSAVALFVAGMFWFISALLCLPTAIFVPISYLIEWLEEIGWPFFGKGKK